MPGFPGSRAVSGASYEALDSLRRPAVISYFKAQGLSLQASIYISKALVNLTRAFSFGAGTEVETSAGRNYFGRLLTIFGAVVYSLRGENNAAPTTFGTKDRVYSLRGEKSAFVPQFSWAGTEVKTSAGREYFTQPISSLGQDTESITSAGRKYFGVLPTIIGTGTEVKTSAGRKCFGRSLTIFGAVVYSLRGEKLAFVPQYSAEQKSCLCGEKQTLLRHTSIGANTEVKTSAGRNYFGWPLKSYSKVSASTADQTMRLAKFQGMTSSATKEKKMVLKKMFVFSAVCLLACVFVCGPARASTLSTNFAEVNVDNLKIGGTYNLTEAARYPLWVSYSGDVPVDLRFEPVVPSPSELKSGYEPVPEASWITFSKNGASLLPDETATADVTITVPNDEKYLGKKYQAFVLITSIPPRGNNGAAMSFSLALKGRILFAVAPKAPTEAELKEIRRNKVRGEAQGVIITPEKFMVSASAGDKKAVITQDTPLKLINPSNETAKIFIEAVDPQPNGISIPRGYAKGDLKSIEISKQRFTLKKDGIMNVEMKANLNIKEAGKLFYAVKITISTGTLELSRFVKVYIN
jgi:hypothetical protein